jgi:hypothetical protein
METDEEGIIFRDLDPKAQLKAVRLIGDPLYIFTAKYEKDGTPIRGKEGEGAFKQYEHLGGK